MSPRKTKSTTPKRSRSTAPSRPSWKRDEPVPPPPPEQLAMPQRAAERDDPRDDVADFSRPSKEVFYRPGRVELERQEFWKERAAIRQFEGGFERWIAERLAYEEDLRGAVEAKVIR